MTYLEEEEERSLTYNLSGCFIFVQHNKKMTDKNLNAKPQAEEILFTLSVLSCLKDLSELCAM